MNPGAKPHMSTLEQGRIEAHRHMLATIVLSLDPVTRATITNTIRHNTAAGEIMALNLQASDEWIAGYQGERKTLLTLLQSATQGSAGDEPPPQPPHAP